MKSSAESALALQLKAAGLRFEREFPFAHPRRWRADFVVWQLPKPDPEQVSSIGTYFVDFPVELISGMPEPERGTLAGDHIVLVEVQGGLFSGGRHVRGAGAEADCEKFAHAAACGWRVLPVSPRMVKDGTALALVQAALGVGPIPKLKPRPHPAKRNLGAPRPKSPPRGMEGLPSRVREAAGRGRR